MKTELYIMRTLSNMHAGSGDINFDIIDKQVQRNHLGLPNINSSSLKGALREHFEKQGQLTNYIFGPPNNGNNLHQTGAYSFFEAHLLTRPVRSNVKPYFNAISTEVIVMLLEAIDDFCIVFDTDTKSALETMKVLSPEKGEPMIFENLDNVKIENFTATNNATFDVTELEKLEDFLGKDLVLFHHEDYKNLSRPILSRNHLNNGVSQNLWYEEVVPKQSKFYFVLGKPTNLDITDRKKLENFDNKFDGTFEEMCAEIDGSESAYESQIQKIVQIGANASIGYGYTRITKASS